MQGRGFWCASNGTDCCHNAARLDMGQMVNVTVTSLSGSISSYSSPSATSSTSSPSDTAASSPSDTTASSPSDTTASSQSAACTSEINCPNPKKNTAVAAGVGAGLGVCLLIALITLLMQRRIYTKNMRNKEAMINALNSAGAQPHKDGPVDTEMRKRTVPVELGPPDAWIHEVHGNHS
ncbi:uncharacterized protein N7498_000940 [Penicillium cinerascens]|uniref:Mid2 domain-containing protein n=1 Tax=Penicillium cinerascens TaxID=70096 RepID=A0A9W9TDS2_9EURO|nr:uncharacterized protein N7498_000940 [Penicillium cinerascens]KAJ5218841.1 hypothetical protein N7498_000940 [Penicillium cinerascens]